MTARRSSSILPNESMVMAIPCICDIVNEIHRDLLTSDEVLQPRDVCEALVAKIKQLPGHGLHFIVRIIEGEQRHSRQIATINWPLRHTWVVVGFDDGQLSALYIDLTCRKFQSIYHDIPNMYCDRYPPKWFLPDSENSYLIAVRRNSPLVTPLRIVQYMHGVANTIIRKFCK